MDLWTWISNNLWSAAGLAAVISLLASWLFDKAPWWPELDGRLKVLIYAGLALLLLAGSVGLAVAFGHSYPALEDLTGVLIFAVLALVGGPLSHEMRKIGGK